MKPPVYLFLCVTATFLLLFAVEKWFPLRRPKAALWTRVILNLALSGLAFVAALTAVRPWAFAAMDWSAHSSVGLLHFLSLPSWMEIPLGILLLDLSFYYWHLLNHKIPFLWRFHNVHHLDPDLDVSTGFRFHFGEVLLSTIFRVAQVILTGVSFGIFIGYELIFQAGTLFHHSNVRLPIRLERFLNFLLVTPRMHGIHHSQVQRETNSNYGVVFCWWDRLHRTLGLNIPQHRIVIGVPGYAASEDNTFLRSLLHPFQKQRDYWRKPDGTVPAPNATNENPHRLVE